jgi:uncharacterized surface protein with fasciclin (FAS1) repeats
MMRNILTAAACLLAAACQQQGNDQAASGNGAAASLAAVGGEAQSKQSIADGLAGAAGHGRFVNALKAAGLDDTLGGAQPYTVFAPTDDAFARLQGGGADALLAPENKARLVSVLTGHIVPGTVTADDLRKAIDRGNGKAQIATVGGGTLTFTRDGDSIAVAGPDGSRGRISGAESLQSNGVVHAVDTVLMPD